MGRTAATLAVFGFTLAFGATEGVGTQSAPDGRAVGSAKSVFERFIALDNARDLGVLDLVAEDAVIKVRTEKADGQVREMQFPVSEWKDLIRETWSLAGGAKPDISTYTDCRYTPVGKSVRVACTRRSQQDPSPSSLTVLIGPGIDNRWLIREHVVESRARK